MRILKLMFFLPVILLFYSCEKLEKDNINPIIHQFKVLTPEVNPGEEVKFSYVVSDVGSLNQYRLQIQNDFSKSWKSFEMISIDDLNGNRQNGEIAILLPYRDSILAGPYKAALQVIDKKGNLSDAVEGYFSIIDDEEQPQIEVSNFYPPVNEGEIDITPGDTLFFEVLASDNTGLSNLTIRLVGEESGVLLFNRQINFPDSTPEWDLMELEHFPVVPTGSEVGNYLLTFKLSDVDGHYNRITFPVKIH